MYIALGDSYTSAPLISKPMGTWGGDGPGYSNPENPYTCGKSDRNYPHLIAKYLGLFNPNDPTTIVGEEPGHPGFIDISCGSAKTEDMESAQQDLPGGGYNPPQFSAFERVDPTAEVVKLVTIGIGGNDLGFGELQDKCVQEPTLTGTPCREHYENANHVGDPSIDGDIIQHRLGALRLALDHVLARIHALAPEAEVLIFSYPALLPEHRDLPVAQMQDGCYPYIPILPTDAAYLREAEKALNATIRSSAEANDAHYVDWYGPSIGHDMCQPPGRAWVNGVVLAPPSFPVHPNLLGTRGAANAGIAVLGSIPGFSFAG